MPEARAKRCSPRAGPGRGLGPCLSVDRRLVIGWSLWEDKEGEEGVWGIDWGRVA